MFRTTLRHLMILTVLAVLLPPTGSAQQSDFFETDFDGVWVGTIDAAGGELLLQLNVNIADGEAIGTIFSHEPGDDVVTAFAPSFGKIAPDRIVVSFEPVESRTNGRAGRAVATSLTLEYEAATDSLSGTAKGAVRGGIELVRMDAGRPLTRLWSGSFKSGGEDVPVLLQLAETADDSGGRFAVESVAGRAWVGEEPGEVDGSRNGNSVELTFRLPSGDTTLSARLKRKNSQLKGTLDIDGSPKLKLVPLGSNNGKPMKAAKVTADDIPAGGNGLVTVKGRNFGVGALVHADDPRVTVLGVDLVSPKRLDVFVATDEDIDAGTQIALRVINGDGQTEDRARAFDVVAEDTGGNGDISFTSDVQPIFSANCAVAGCHASGSAQAGLVLASGSAFGNIVNVPSTQRATLDRIEPGDPDNSYLVNKIRGDAGIQGGRMPLNRTPLTTDQIATIVAWVQAGAANNSPARR